MSSKVQLLPLFYALAIISIFFEPPTKLKCSAAYAGYSFEHNESYYSTHFHLYNLAYTIGIV
jgi:hypothetical protein